MKSGTWVQFSVFPERYAHRIVWRQAFFVTVFVYRSDDLAIELAPEFVRAADVGR